MRSPEEIAAAQKVTVVRLIGVEQPRVRYGEENEDWGADRKPCHDCGVSKGQLHVPGCDAERCPVCGGQVIYCECEEENSFRFEVLP